MNGARLKTFLLAVLLAMTTIAVANPPDHAKGKGGKPDKAERGGHDDRGPDVEIDIDLVSGLISAADARRIAVDTGVTGYKPLPPGIRKNLARGKPMPPGIAKTRLPGGYLERLPHRDGYDWHVAGTDLLLVQAGTQLVAEVLQDVFR